MTNSTEFIIGVSACTVVRVGWCSFAVHPRDFHGSHVLELVAVPDSSGVEYFTAYLDGVLFATDGALGLWDLLDLPVGGHRIYDSES